MNIQVDDIQLQTKKIVCFLIVQNKRQKTRFVKMKQSFQPKQVSIIMVKLI
jgi:hypothetical protein